MSVNPERIGNNLSHSSVISADGGFVAFKSDASDLVLTGHTTNTTVIRAACPVGG